MTVRQIYNTVFDFALFPVLGAFLAGPVGFMLGLGVAAVMMIGRKR